MLILTVGFGVSTLLSWAALFVAFRSLRDARRRDELLHREWDEDRDEILRLIAERDAARAERDRLLVNLIERDAAIAEMRQQILSEMKLIADRLTGEIPV